MNTIPKHIILFFLVLVIFCPASAQINTFRNVNSNGLVDFQVNCFYKDSKGFIWTGGSYKVQRFDGKNFVVYDKPQGVEKTNTISESLAGQLYFGTTKGLFTLTTNGSELQAVLPSKLQDNIHTLHIDSLNRIFAGTDNGLVMLSNDTIERVQIQRSDFPFNQVISVDYTSTQLVWLLTPGGVVAFNPITKKLLYSSIHTKTNSSYCTSMTRVDSTIFVGTTAEGIYALNTSTGVVKPFINVGNGAITCISSDEKSKLYAGTAGTGVFLISVPNKKVYRTFNTNPPNTDKISSGMITSLMVDDFGILWLGSSEHLGFDYMFLVPKPFMIYNTPSFTSFNVPINKFYLGDGFKLLSGLYGLYYISEKDGSVHTYEAGVGKAKSLKPGKVNSIVPFNDKIILGGEGGAYVFDPSNLTLNVFEPLAPINDATIFHMTTDSDGNLWIASANGLSILNTKTNIIETYTTSNSNIPDDLVRFIYADSHSRKWICTNKGICFWDEEKKDFYLEKFPTGFVDKTDVHFLMEDKDGNFLICYDEKKVVFSSADFQTFRPVCTEKEAGFTGLRILKILQETSGNYWFIGSRGGIVANESLDKYEMYSISEGLYQPYATDGALDSNGRLWLSNNGGFYHASENFTRLNAPLVITDLKVNGASKIHETNSAIENEEQIVLNYNENNIEFQFSLLDYTRPDLMVYECKLEGVDSWWNILRGVNKINYKNLPPGKYTFVVRHNMDMNSTQKVYVEIKPILSKNTLTFLLVLLVLLIVGLYKFKILKKNQDLKQKLEAKEVNKPFEQKYQFNKISKEKADRIIDKLELCMKNKQMHLNENLKMSDLAKELECSSQTLSQVFNLFLNEKYNEYINRYRVDAFKQIVSSMDHSKYTLKSLAQKSGFSSYTSFYRAFKEQTGSTPNEYIQGLE